MNAQIHEVGVFAGGSNYIGDVGSTTYIIAKQTRLWEFYTNGIKIQDLLTDFHKWCLYLFT